MNKMSDLHIVRVLEVAISREIVHNLHFLECGPHYSSSSSSLWAHLSSSPPSHFHLSLSLEILKGFRFVEREWEVGYVITRGDKG